MFFQIIGNFSVEITAEPPCNLWSSAVKTAKTDTYSARRAYEVFLGSAISEIYFP